MISWMIRACFVTCLRILSEKLIHEVASLRASHSVSAFTENSLLSRRGRMSRYAMTSSSPSPLAAPAGIPAGPEIAASRVLSDINPRKNGWEDREASLQSDGEGYPRAGRPLTIVVSLGPNSQSLHLTRGR